MSNNPKNSLALGFLAILWFIVIVIFLKQSYSHSGIEDLQNIKFKTVEDILNGNT